MATRARPRRPGRGRAGQRPVDNSQQPAPINWRLVTRSQLAEVFGVVPLRITKWAGEGMPVADRGGRGMQSRYDVRAVIEWRISAQVQARTGGVGPNGAVVGEMVLPIERAKLARAQTRKAELDMRVRERELLEVEDVARTWGSIAAAIRARLLSMPKAMADRVMAARENGLAAIEAMLTTEVHDALRELASWQPEAVAETR